MASEIKQYVLCLVVELHGVPNYMNYFSSTKIKVVLHPSPDRYVLTGQTAYRSGSSLWTVYSAVSWNQETADHWQLCYDYI